VVDGRRRLQDLTLVTTTPTGTGPPAPTAGRSLAGPSALLFASQVLGNAGYFVSVLALARGLEPAERGIYAFATATAMVAARMLLFGVSRGLMVLSAKSPDNRQRLLATSVSFTVAAEAIGSAVLALGLLSGLAPIDLTTTEVVVLSLGVVGSGLVWCGSDYLIGTSSFRTLTVVSSLGPWLYAALMVAFALGPGLSVLLALVSFTAVHGVWGVVVCGLGFRLHGVAAPDRELLRPLLGFGLRSWAGSLAEFLSFRFDQILMAFLATEAALGIYAIAVNLSEVTFYLPGAIATALVPAVAAAARADQERRTIETVRVVTVTTAATIVLGVVIGAPLLPLLFGENYKDSVLPYLILLPGALGFAVGAVFTSGLLASGRPGRSSLVAVVALVTGTALDLILIPSYDEIGAAIAATIALLAGAATGLLAYRSVHRFPWSELVPRRDDVRRLGGAVGAFAARART
jgi:O-antigen/teichoic acid export membrane protein